MAVTEVFNTDNKKVGEVELNDGLFGLEVKKHILHDVVKMQLANRRAGTASTKTRTEVRGGGAKPYRQKGTGRARAGTNRSPLWRGGGVIFGPKPRDYSYKLPKKVRKLGVRMALSTRFSEKNILVLDGFDLADIKTKQFVDVMKKLNIENGLIVIPEKNENLEKSSRNVHGYKVIQADGLNVYDILLHRRLVLLQPCLGQLEKRLLA
ncbi:MAG: 50S ribosomal protein L4 [Desulfobulbaceae bacterium]|jgi:large subunit ribosomal protein L4|nr:MAG: 50S ribosomal protein L4 [Desulfobulbaceae bacterium]